MQFGREVNMTNKVDTWYVNLYSKKTTSPIIEKDDWFIIHKATIRSDWNINDWENLLKWFPNSRIGNPSGKLINLPFFVKYIVKKESHPENELKGGGYYISKDDKWQYHMSWLKEIVSN